MKTFADFAQKFKTLNNTEKDFLKLLTVCFEPVSQTEYAKLLRSCELKKENGRAFIPKDVREFRNELIKSNWLEKDKMSRLKCHPNYEEYLMRVAILDENFPFWIDIIRKQKPHKIFFTPVKFEPILREFRIALYEGNESAFMENLRFLQSTYSQKWDEAAFVQQVFLPFDARWFATYKPIVQSFAIQHFITSNVQHLMSIEDNICNYLLESKTLVAKNTSGTILREQLIYLYLFQGKIKDLAGILSLEADPSTYNEYAGIVAFLQGKYPEAAVFFEKATKLYRKERGSRTAELESLAGVFRVLNLLALKPANYLKSIQIHQERVRSQSLYVAAFSYLKAVALFQNNRIDDSVELLHFKPQQAIDTLIWGLASYWNQGKVSSGMLKQLEDYFSLAQQNHYDWIAMELAGVLAKQSLAPKLKKKYENLQQEYQEQLGLTPLIGLVPIVEKWERSLDALLKLTTKKKGGGTKSKEEKTARLIWLVDFEKNHLQPKEQTLNKSGKWSKGRNIALKRFKEEGVLSATENDNKVRKAVKSYSYGYYGQKEYHIVFEAAVQALVGHPLLFLERSPNVSVELVEKEPEMIVEEKDGHFVLKFEEDFNEAGVYIKKETPTRYLLLKVNETHDQINNLLDKGRLKIPAKAKEKVIKAIGNLSASVTVHSEVGEKAKGIPTVKADATTYVHMLPLGDGFKLEFFVKPFQSDPPYFKPGQGRENVMAEIKGIRTQAKRDLTAENENADFVENACPTFRNADGYNQEWHFEEIEDCLNILLQLEPLKKTGKAVLEHPKGEKLRLAGQVDFANLSMKIKKQNDWFGMDGELKVNDKKVLDFRQLLHAIEHSDMPFVQLGDGEFLALTTDLQRRLKEINSLMHQNKGSLQFHPLTAPVMEDFTDMLDDLKVDAAWKKQVKLMSEAQAVNPSVPSTFKATLRDYQLEGFRWLSQLAYWGVGACLADDMGLGKTIQSLAVLLDRAKDGPAFVVAPASVARNWLREAEKFAPTLNPLLFGTGNRKKMVANLKPFDLLICSYGLMQQEGELLAEAQFNTIILDEAQAIKNKSTKRSKAAMNLKGNFKILTTGTPIENHLGELWNLFNFLNPGLLGSESFFQDNYAVPIEKNKDKEKRQQLKRLIQPFILRRRKSDVLDELPPKTEVTLSVELSEEERAFYEALRQSAVENIEAMGDDSNSRFAILAELMKLRQACCHPKMVMPESQIPSSKLQLFEETITELVENGHKALVFSQFVKHLKLVEALLKKKGIRYQYLDGSTPLKQREKAINAFQAGEGDVFLISLKAGGVGLNLTAADYVLHLDPWWNPAVEDQASDRAHRMGQKRPVTIYRLVAENTIEDKIVKLHGEKRDLADSLLEGTEASAKLSAKDLMGLIRGE